MEKTTHTQTSFFRDEQSANSLISDRFGRTFNYLRLSVNEYCNLRCIYCMPEEGVPFRSQDKLLTTDEICRLIETTSQMGVSKIRFTGGEPLLRKDLLELIQLVHEIDGIDSIHLTTNGTLLSKQINSLKDAGLTGINISLDTLNPEKFNSITRGEGLDLVLDGLEKANQSGISSIKVNVVVMRDFNNDELLDFIQLTKENDVTVRFIELMPFDAHQIWKTGKFYRAEQIISDLKKQVDELVPVNGSRTEHHIFRKNGYKGKVAVIPSYTRNLCGECNRIRITADGKLMNCLYSQNETNLRDAMRNGSSNEEIGSFILDAMMKKHKDGWDAQNQGNDNRESMTQIGG
ncbi:MAG: GTP 3',8-cyclase MoaA [Candidatus Marinimicrobia bacterium]|nr:GTP 3',8-cyclase MoaA [Candidatus Neomarinimicrobiota bacterium]